MIITDWILRLLVGGAFVAAGVLKLADPAKFALDVSHYRLLPHEATHLVAILVPGIEVVAGFCVLTGIRLRAAAGVITGLTALFFFVIVSALARGLNIECGCFGTIGGTHVGLVNLAIDLTLFCLAALLLRRSSRAYPQSPPAPRPLPTLTPAPTPSSPSARRHEPMFPGRTALKSLIVQNAMRTAKRMGGLHRPKQVSPASEFLSSCDSRAVKKRDHWLASSSGTLELMASASESSSESWNADVSIAPHAATDSATRTGNGLAPETERSSCWSLVRGDRQSVFCLATSREHADQIIHRLKLAGFSIRNLSAVFPDPEVSETAPRGKMTPVHRRNPTLPARTAWLVARRVGFATIGALSIPGLGSCIVVGPMTAALKGVATDSVSDRLCGIGMPPVEAARYEALLKERHTLISVLVANPEEMTRAKEIFTETRAREMCATGETSVKESSGTEYASRPATAAHSHTRPQLCE